MKIRLAKKIMKQKSLYENTKLNNNGGIKCSDKWFDKFIKAEEYDWDNPYSYSDCRGYFDPPALNVNRKIDHRITKAISFTSKKKHDKSKAKG